MTIHTLEKQKHNDFLNQKRIDPITGDILQEGNQVVICASCKSAFLVDSWEYMSGRDCNQSLTLKEIPVSEVVRIEKNIFVDLLELKTYSNFDAAFKAAAPYSLTGFASFFIVHSLGFIELNTINLAHLVSWFFVLIFYAESSYKKLIKIENNVLIFNKSNEAKGAVQIDDIISIQIAKPKGFFLSNMIGRLYKSDKNVYSLKITDKNYFIYTILMHADQLELINAKTSLLKKLNKNSLSFLSVNKKIEKI